MTAPERLASALADRYRVDRELGAGGMATVYLAYDLKHDRRVAIKVLRPELSAILGAERFAREIRITGQLSHPHILQVLDSGEDAAIGLCWYAMPYVEGESLRDRLTRETQLPIDDALKLFGEIADALDHAHRHGFVHRDLKPENILLQDGHARVADFGIARSMSAVGSDKLTETGLALGTPQYMSPEQASGYDTIDARSDIYALGCLLYEMLAGNPPFQGPTTMAIMARHAVDPVPGLRTVRSTVPLPVEAAITKALAKVPADRFTSAAQFVEAFSKPVPVLPRAGLRGRGTGLIAGAVIALLLVAGGWFFARSRRPHITPSASVIAVLPFGTNGDSALMRLSHDLVLTVSAGLDGQGGIRTADPQMVLSEADDSRSGQYLPNALALGKRLGAGSVVVGSIVQQGPNVQLDLKLMSTIGDSQPLARVSVANSADSISALTDSITWALLRQVWRRGDPPSPSYANLTTRSVPALRAFLDGERLSQAGRFLESADAYAAAIKADSTFWLAGWRFNSVQGWLEQDFDPELARGYQSHLDTFGERDRMLIEAEMNSDSVSELSEASHIARHRAIAEKFPADWKAQSAYVDILFHDGPVLGYTNTQVREALQRTLDLNPKLVAMWDHLALASFGHDSAQAARATSSIRKLGFHDAGTAKYGFDTSLMNRVRLAAGGQVPPAMLDSLAVGVTRAKVFFHRLIANFFLNMNGFAAAQIEMNRRFLALDPHGPLEAWTWEGIGDAWASRGAWDSALVAYDRRAALRPLDAVLNYQTVVVGAMLGGLDTTRAEARRTAAARYVTSLPADSSDTKEQVALLAWADGMLAVLRREPGGLKDARASLQRSGATGADFLDRSLAGFELELKGAKQAAAESLAVLDLAAVELFPRDPYARSVNHLAASRWLLEQGDTTRALKVLYWHQAFPAGSPDPGRFQVFAPFAYYEVARIEDAQGRTDQARDNYQQFIRRYDRPPPAHQHMVDEANAALRRLAGQDDVPRKN